MSSKKILLVDDEPAILSVLSARLKAADYEICTANDGLEAIGKVKTDKPDLIIMDVLMPRMTGFEAMKLIRDIPAARMTPAIVISARGSMRDFFTEITGVEFISKPYESQHLMERIEFLLGNREVASDGLQQVILMGVEDFLVEKIKVLLSSLKFHVMTALNEEDALMMARNLHPAFILCQFWEEASVLDAKKLSEKLAEHAELVSVPLYAYCKEALSIEGMKTFKGDRLIAYKESSDLLKKLELILRKNVSR